MDKRKNTKISIGKLIKSKRKKKKLTQTELAKLVGLSARHIGKLEDGTYSPRFDTYLKLSDILDIKQSEMYNCINFRLRDNEEKIINIIKEMDNNTLNLCLELITSVKLNTEQREENHA